MPEISDCCITPANYLTITLLCHSGQCDQSRLLRERLAELEIEIERFKKENTALTKLRQENERNQEILR